MKINTLLTLLAISLILMLYFGCSHQKDSNGNSSGWSKVFKNDANGKALFGKKEVLIDAVRKGYPIRIGWGSRRIEHVAPADFLTIGDGKELFAQIRPIMGQRPDFSTDTLKMGFRTNNKWVKMVGTNGYNAAMMIDYLADTIVNYNDSRMAPTTWYVDFPSNDNGEKGIPLWLESSPLWEK